MGIRESTTQKNKSIQLVGRKFPELAGTMFIGVVGRFSDGLENNELWARLWKDTAGREADLVAIAALQHIVGWNAQRQKENLKEIWEGPYL